MGIKSILNAVRPFWNKKIIIPAIIIIAFIVYQQVTGIIESTMMAKMMAKPPKVTLAQVEEGEIFPKSQSSGRIVAKYSVDVIARIQGFLQKSYFKEGAYVKKGQTLFLIEPNEYQNAVNQSSAQVREAQAQLINDEKSLKRAVELVKRDFVSKSYYDEALAKRDATRASLDLSRAALAQARLNLSYTNVKSPVDGKIGEILITEGNFVNASSGVLARIVSVDPVYVTFTMKSEDFVRYTKSGVKANDFSFLVPELVLSDGTIYDGKGVVDFVGNEVDETTGTINMRATFENKKNVLVPGDFVTVNLTSKIKQKVVFVDQSAVIESAQGAFVYVVDDEGKAQIRMIEKDGQYEGKWIVKSGIKPGESYILTNIQGVKPNGAVEIVENSEDINKNKQQTN